MYSKGLISIFTKRTNLKSTLTLSTSRIIFALALSMIILFGSCAKTTATVQNDINIDNKISSIDSSKFLKFNSGINAILHDKNGNIWIGSQSNGMARWDGKSHKYFTSDDGLVDNQVRSLQEDQLGNIWIATGSGISMFDGQKLQIKLNMNNWNANTHPPQVWKSHPDDLWFHAGKKMGVYRYNRQSLNYLPFPQIEDLEDAASYLNTCMAQGKNNQLWFSSYLAVFGFDGDNISVIDNRTLGLLDSDSSLHVRSIFEDSRGNLWIGNNGIGLLLFDGEKIVNFTESHGLSNTHYNQFQRVADQTETLARVFSIGEDLEGNMWFGTADSGVWKYDSNVLINYDTNDGLQDNFMKVIYRDGKGNMWFGTNSGVFKQGEDMRFRRVF